MAHSKAERIGTIFTRVSTLLRCNAITEDKLPLWYDVYKVFPPKYEPRFDRPAPETPVQNIIYKEDIIRAKFQKDVFLQGIDLNKTDISKTQLFFKIYESLQMLGVSEDKIYDQALRIYEQTYMPKVVRK